MQLQLLAVRVHRFSVLHSVQEQDVQPGLEFKLFLSLEGVEQQQGQRGCCCLDLSANICICLDK